MSEKLFDAEKFARSIRVRIAMLNATQADCSRQSGVSKATVSRICSGKREPDVETYLRLMRWMSSHEGQEP